MKASVRSYENCMKYVNILQSQIKEIVGQMVTRCKEQAEEKKSMNMNEIAQRNKNSLNNIQILAKWVNNFDPNNVNDLFQNSKSPEPLKEKEYNSRRKAF